MKIVFTGGGTGGHFYPIIAVVESIREVSKENKILDPELFFISPDPYDKKVLFDNLIIFKKVPTGKWRRYFSIMNFFDLFKTFFGIVRGFWTLFWIYPDVVFSKGGYGSFPVVLAAKILGIPIIIHESDSTPGLANKLAGKYATKIAVSYPEAAKYFDEKKTAWTGNPIRKNIAHVIKDGAAQYLDLEENIPIILVLGGSQGSSLINESIIESLPKLVEKYQIIHQTGKNNFEQISNTAKVVLNENPNEKRYRPFQYLDDLAMKMCAGAADIIITRAGSTLFEIAAWEKPSIIIPITKSNRDHQRINAYTYARFGGGVVIEEKNLTDDIILYEIERIISNKEVKDKMIAGARKFAKPEAAKTIAKAILEIGLKHEKNE